MTKLVKFVHSMSVPMPVTAKNVPASAKKKATDRPAYIHERTPRRTSDSSSPIMAELAKTYFDIYVVLTVIISLWALLVGLQKGSLALGVWAILLFFLVAVFKANYKYNFPPKYDALMVCVNVFPLWFVVPLHFEYLFVALACVHGMFCFLALFTMPHVSRCYLLKRSCWRPVTVHTELPSRGSSPTNSNTERTMEALSSSSDTEEAYF